MGEDMPVSFILRTPEYLHEWTQVSQHQKLRKLPLVG
jgi:hypothetical protein